MVDGEAHVHPSSVSLDKQFEDFRSQLKESRSLRERIRAVGMEIETATNLMHLTLPLVPKSLPTPELLEKAETQIGVLKEQYNRLVEVLREYPGQCYRYHGE